MVGHPARSEDDSDDSVDQITTRDAFNTRITAERTILADFYTEWCGACRRMEPIVDELATECDTSVVKINAEDLPEVAAQYDVRSVPTFLVFEDGTATDRLIGKQDKEKLHTAIA